jgi:nucleoside-diphosphate-sugar epimerase
MTKILITGVNGFIGTHLNDFLSSKGYSTIGITHSQINKSFQKISLLNPTKLNSFLKNNNFDTVIHLASLIEHSDPLKILNVNYNTTLNLLKSCVKNNVSNFIFASSHAVYGETRYLPIDETHITNPQTSYGISKLMGENLCKIFNNYFKLNTSILRISSVYGNNQPKTKLIPKLILNSKKSKKIILHKHKNGFQIMDMIHVDDVCNSILCAIKTQKNFGIYNIATGKSITVEDIAKNIKKINNSKISIKNISKNTNHYKYNTRKASSDLKFKSKIKFERKIEDIYYNVIQNE